MRLGRNPLKRMHKTASKHKRAKGGPDGLSCVHCNPVGQKLRKQVDRDRAHKRHMEGIE